MDTFKTIKKETLLNGAELHLVINNEGVYFIFFESYAKIISHQWDSDIPRFVRQMYWNGLYECDANIQFNHLFMDLNNYKQGQ